MEMTRLVALNNALYFFKLILAVTRLSYLFNEERGPMAVFEQFRVRVGNGEGFLAAEAKMALACPWCTIVWCAIILTLLRYVVPSKMHESVIDILASSMAAVYIYERL